MSQECVDCRKPKATLQCESCLEPVCKTCVQLLPGDSFQFLKTVPEELQKVRYCGGCYDEHVAPALQKYEADLEAAEKVFVFYKTQRASIPLLDKAKEPYRVPECKDRDETILRLAFFAAQEGYNAIIAVDVSSEKVRNHAYQTSKWRGTGLGANVDAAKVDRDENPRWERG